LRRGGEVVGWRREQGEEELEGMRYVGEGEWESVL